MHSQQNRKLIAEINELHSLTRGQVVGRSNTGTTVTAVGSFYSPTLQQTIHLALKDYPKWGDTLDIRTACELGLMELIEENLIHIVPELPIIHGLAVNLEGKSYGVITEDYSKGGTIDVRGAAIFHDPLPYDLQSFLDSPKSETPHDLGTTCFFVNEQRKLGDFEEFLMDVDQFELSQRVYRRLADYTIRTPIRE